MFGYCEGLGYKASTQEILIILDKIGKIGQENALKELLALGVKENDGKKLVDMTKLSGNFAQVLDKLKDLSDNELYQKGLAELSEVYSYLKAYNVNENNFVLDIGIIRGQNYYTGTVFEAIMPSHPEFGTVCGGGRYDNLAGFYTDKKMPGVGLSIGLTRLFDLLDKNDMLGKVKPNNIDLQLIPLGNTLLHCLELQSYFNQSIVCYVCYDNRSFKAKMKDANRREIPYIIVVGENEVANGVYSLKNMATGEQINLSKEECLKKLTN